MISVIIPTYDNVEALDLCLKSCIEGQEYENEIIVVIDNEYDIFEETIEKYKTHISILPLGENQGLSKATNLGVYNASNEYILIVNDDNVFPKGWDDTLLVEHKPNSVLTPNQIEPRPSMFPQFKIINFGETPQEFKYEEFINRDIWSTKLDNCGSTLPIFMTKTDYLRVGGWDENYPSNGIVADWDFFLKCQLSGMEMIRTYACHFYHFGSLTVKDEKRQKTEREAHEYAKYKWGSYIKHDPTNNLKYL